MNPSLSHAWTIAAEDFPFSGSAEEQIRFLLRYAILAPSVHNTQPWQCRIEKKRVEVYFDPAHALPVSDASNREAYISLGAFTANFCLAAQVFGLRAAVEWLPVGRDNLLHAATVTLEGTAQAPEEESLLQAILNRRTNRVPYSKREVPESVLASLREVTGPGTELHVVKEPTEWKRIVQLINYSTQLGFSRRPFRAELAHYILPNTSQREQGIPGYTANYNLIQSLAAPHLIRRFNTGKSQGATDSGLYASAPAHFVLSTETDAHLAWLQSGYALEVICLTLTAAGCAYSILAGPVEAPTCADKLRQILKTERAPQVIFCAGYTKKVSRHSPRRPVSAILM